MKIVNLLLVVTCSFSTIAMAKLSGPNVVTGSYDIKKLDGSVVKYTVRLDHKTRQIEVSRSVPQVASYHYKYGDRVVVDASPEEEMIVFEGRSNVHYGYAAQEINSLVEESDNKVSNDEILQKIQYAIYTVVKPDDEYYQNGLQVLSFRLDQDGKPASEEAVQVRFLE